MITRRQFVRQLAMAAGGLLPWTRAWAGMRFEVGGARTEEPSGPFVFAQVQYRGGDWDPHPSASVELLKEVDRRTSIAVSFQRHTLTYPRASTASAICSPFRRRKTAGRVRSQWSSPSRT